MKYADLILPLGVFLFLTCAFGPELRRETAEADSGMARQEELWRIGTGVDQKLTVAVGAGETKGELAVWVLEPEKGTRVRGVVLLLHGFLANHWQVQPAGAALRRAGYRAVLVDLRGFGESAKGPITFGVLDAQDLKRVANVLREKELCGNQIGVYGTSYGAAAAILFAAADPRVKAVVAVAPFAEIRAEVPSFGRNALGSFGDWLSDAGLNSLADSISRAASLDLDNARPIEAISRTKAEILLIHGTSDDIVPAAASEKLHAAGAGHSELKMIRGRGHLELCFDVRGELHGTTRAWFEQWLADDTVKR